MKKVTIVGAGLAGCEACWQLVKRGIPVRLIEMRPKKSSPAHQSDAFAELVCSNSLRSDSLLNAVGILKEEMRVLQFEETAVSLSGERNFMYIRFSMRKMQQAENPYNIHSIQTMRSR